MSADGVKSDIYVIESLWNLNFYVCDKSFVFIPDLSLNGSLHR